MLNVLCDLPFNIQHRTFNILVILSARRGGEWGLVASAVFKTVVSARKRRKVGSIPTRLRQSGVGHDCVVPNFGRGTAQPCPTAYCLGASVRNPIFIAPPSCAASIASTARSKGI